MASFRQTSFVRCRHPAAGREETDREAASKVEVLGREARVEGKAGRNLADRKEARQMAPGWMAASSQAEGGINR
jgi:hypothetical protein